MITTKTTSSSPEAILAFQPPFKYVQNPPSIVDAAGNTVLELRGFPAIMGYTYNNGEEACDLQDGYGENLIKFLESDHKSASRYQSSTHSLQRVLSLLREYLGEETYDRFIRNCEVQLDTKYVGPEPHKNFVFTLAVHLCKKRGGSMERIRDWYNIIDKSLGWSNTPEGLDYWSQVNERVKTYLRNLGD